MSHHVTCLDGVLTIRLDGRSVAQEVYQDIRTCLDDQSMPVIAVLDLTLASGLDQQLKSMLYRAFQHHLIARAGICGINPNVSQDVADLLPVLRRVRKITVSETEPDLRAALGLIAATPQRKLSGILAYLKKD